MIWRLWTKLWRPCMDLEKRVPSHYALSTAPCSQTTSRYGNVGLKISRRYWTSTETLTPPSWMNYLNGQRQVTLTRSQHQRRFNILSIRCRLVKGPRHRRNPLWCHQIWRKVIATTTVRFVHPDMVWRECARGLQGRTYRAHLQAQRRPSCLRQSPRHISVVSRWKSLCTHPAKQTQRAVALLACCVTH